MCHTGVFNLLSVCLILETASVIMEDAAFFFFFWSVLKDFCLVGRGLFGRRPGSVFLCWPLTLGKWSSGFPGLEARFRPCGL